MATLEGADKGFAADVNAFIAANKGVKLTSGYRSPEHQAQLFATAVKKYGSEKAARKWVAPPGKSNHNHGKAADLAGIEKMSAEQLAKFNLYRPMAWEPWHVEPIGHRGDHDSYTTPPANVPAVEDPTKNVMEQFSAAVFTMGQQPSTVGQQQTSAGVQGPTVDGSTPQPSPEEQKSAQPLTEAIQANAAAQPQISGGDDVDKLLDAIGGQESNNNYLARNKDSGAAGKYQFMPSSWAAWSKEAGLGPNAPMSAVNQEKVARMKMSQYVSAYGMRGAAIAWYGGPGAVKYANKNASQGKYPSINKYADQVLARIK